MSDREGADIPLYPNENAFVVKFRRRSSPGLIQRGQVEHLTSGRVHRFADIDGLVEFMLAILLPDAETQGGAQQR